VKFLLPSAAAFCQLIMAIVAKIRSLFRPLPEPDVIIAAPQTSYAIRPLTVTQIAEVVQLNARCFKSGENYSKGTFNFLLTQPTTLAYRAVTPSEKMVGFIVITVGEDNIAHLATVGVSPEHRRRGIAEKLLFHAENGLKKRKISTISLEVRVSNNTAQSLYRDLGYFVTQRIENYYTNGEDGFMMVKSLL
jgi:[ribosomal protein S18]-alanine N-acetyltransferase